MPAQSPISVTDSSGGTASIPAYNMREEVMISVSGGLVWIAFNEAAVAGKGIPLPAGTYMSITTARKRTADIYFVCDTGAQATVYWED